MTPVNIDLRIRDAMEDEGCRRYPELFSSANTAGPFDDEINVQREIAGPVLIVRVADAELDLPKCGGSGARRGYRNQIPYRSLLSASNE